MVKVKISLLQNGRYRAEVVEAEHFFTDGSNRYEAVGRLIVLYNQRFPDIRFEDEG